MKKILFVCYGNICRSPMAEFVMKKLAEEAGLSSELRIDSAATSREEIGNPVYPQAKRKLAEHKISCEGHAARQMTKGDYDEYDLLIGMDGGNLRDMRRICGGDPDCWTTQAAPEMWRIRGTPATLKPHGETFRRAAVGCSKSLRRDEHGYKGQR